jgi:hypothetical protein
MSVRSLVRAVTGAEGASQFWAAQQQLCFAVELEEALITKRRRQASRLAHEKKAHARSEYRNIDRIRRFDELISTCRWYEEQHSLRRGTVLYLGDTLAYKLLPEHYINCCAGTTAPGSTQARKAASWRCRQQSTW